MTDEQVMLREAVRDFVSRQQIRERARAWDERGSFPLDAWRELAATGWCGLTVPAEMGGQGGTVTDAAIVIEELARGDVSLAATFMANQFGGAQVLSAHGTPAQRQRYLPDVCSGAVMFAFAVTEPDGGTDVLSVMRTRAERDGTGWRLNGSKMYTTGATYSQYILVLARTEAESARKSEGLTLFIVPHDAPGVEIQKLETISMRASETTQTFYSDVRLSDDDVVGEPGKGFKLLLGSLNNERILMSALCNGIAAQALEEAIEYARNRHAFGRPIGAFQALQHELARCATRLEASRLLSRHAAELLERDLPCQAEAAMAKLTASELAWDTALAGTRLMGGLGISLEHPMQRYLRNAWPGMNGPMTNEQALNIIGESLGLPRSY